MKKLAQNSPNVEPRVQIAVSVYEAGDGALYLARDTGAGGGRVYHDIGQLEGGQGLTLMLVAALDLLEDLPSQPVSDYVDDTGTFNPPGDLIAYFDTSEPPSGTSIMIYPFRCGHAGRRLFGLPTLS